MCPACSCGRRDGEGAADAADQLRPRQPRRAARRRAARGGRGRRAARGVHVDHNALEALPPAALPARPVRHRRPPPALRAQYARFHVHRSRCAHCSLLTTHCSMFNVHCCFLPEAREKLSFAVLCTVLCEYFVCSIIIAMFGL